MHHAKDFNGKLYGTETATEICDVSPTGFHKGDFSWDDTRLYRTRAGAYFLAGEGGARSRWAKRVGQNGHMNGDGTMLLDEQDARPLVEHHATYETYVDLFGEPAQG